MNVNEELKTVAIPLHAKLATIEYEPGEFIDTPR